MLGKSVYVGLVELEVVYQPQRNVYAVAALGALELDHALLVLRQRYYRKHPVMDVHGVVEELYSQTAQGVQIAAVYQNVVDVRLELVVALKDLKQGVQDLRVGPLHAPYVRRRPEHRLRGYVGDPVHREALGLSPGQHVYHAFVRILLSVVELEALQRRVFIL